MNIADYIREIPDFPVPGILFKDITPLLKSPAAFRHVIDTLARHYAERAIDAVIGIEARGFLVAAPLALHLGKPLVPVRKAGKLPLETLKAKYALEYGYEEVEVHTDAIEPGQRVLVVDDVLATGGTLEGTAKLVERCGATVAGIGVLLELAELRGRERLKGYRLESLLQV